MLRFFLSPLYWLIPTALSLLLILLSGVATWRGDDRREIVVIRAVVVALMIVVTFQAAMLAPIFWFAIFPIPAPL